MPLSSLSFGSSGWRAEGGAFVSFSCFCCRLRDHDLGFFMWMPDNNRSQPYQWIHADFVSSFLLISEERSLQDIDAWFGAMSVFLYV